MTTQTSAPTAAPVAGKIAIVRELPSTTKDSAPSFMCVVDGITVGTSKHKDYFEFHKRRGDIVRLNELEISKFIYVGPDGNIAEQKKVDGAAPARGNVTKAIALASNPKPAPIGFNNQTHAQARENGRKGAIARLKNSGVTGGRPNASSAADHSNATAGASTRSTARAQAAGTKTSAVPPTSKASDKPTGASDRSQDDAKQRAIENGRKGAQRAAELRAQASSGAAKPVKVPGKPGRPRKVNTEHAS